MPKFEFTVSVPINFSLTVEADTIEQAIKTAHTASIQDNRHTRVKPDPAAWQMEEDTTDWSPAAEELISAKVNGKAVEDVKYVDSLWCKSKG